MGADRTADPVANRLGRPRKADLREVVNALLYMASPGGAWRLPLKDFPPFSTVQKCSLLLLDELGRKFTQSGYGIRNLADSFSIRFQYHDALEDAPPAKSFFAIDSRRRGKLFASWLTHWFR